MTNLWTVFYFTLGVSCTGILLMLFKRIFQDKLNARWHYLVWLVLLARVLIPVNVRLFSSSFSLNHFWMEGMKRLRGNVEMGLDSLLSSPFGMDGGQVSLLTEVPLTQWSVTDILFCLYAVGVAVVFLYDVFLYMLLRRQIKKGRDASFSLKEKAAAVAEKYQLPKQKRIRVCNGFETPFLCGFFCPILVVPEKMEENIDEKVLLHELLHLRYHDVLVNFALHLLQALNWFNPLVYRLCHVIRNDSEALCDQRVLERLEGREKQEYGILLLQMADTRHASHIGTTSMANGAKNIKIRIRRIADFGRAPKGASFAAACITVLLCLASVSYAYEPNYFDTSGVETKEDLEQLLEDARYFEVSSPEMAINIYTEAMDKRDLGKMALIVPNDLFEEYQAWALEQYETKQHEGAVLLEGADMDYAFGMYENSESNGIYFNPKQEDGEITGALLYDNIFPTEEGEEKIHYFQLEKENGWKLRITKKAWREESFNLKWDNLWLENQMEEGNYKEWGDWRYTDAVQCRGLSAQNWGWEFWGEPAERAFSDKMTLFVSRSVRLEYIGEQWDNGGNRALVFYLCPAEITDKEIWDSTFSDNFHVIGREGNVSDGSAYAVRLAEKGMKDAIELTGTLSAETIEEVSGLMSQEYELRIYKLDGTRLETIPLKGGDFYEESSK